MQATSQLGSMLCIHLDHPLTEVGVNANGPLDDDGPMADAASELEHGNVSRSWGLHLPAVLHQSSEVLFFASVDVPIPRIPLEASLVGKNPSLVEDGNQELHAIDPSAFYAAVVMEWGTEPPASGFYGDLARFHRAVSGTGMNGNPLKLTMLLNLTLSQVALVLSQPG